MSNTTSKSTQSGRKTKAAAGCGCGCGGNRPSGGSGGSSGCTCNDQPPACPDSGILRPNFFAGQLLTEDDLQQITVYQNGKRRLTNRYVFGTGVVCGLEVVCAGPKAPGSLIIQPGYALDCCGNDIVLSCPYTIDVNAMVREAGLDCGDPCGDADSPRKYLLCVRYTECLSEPVNAYSPGATTTCVNTRVQESCTFELRCQPKKPEPQVTLVRRLRDLLDDEERLALSVDLVRWDELSRKRDLLLPLNRQEPFIKLTDDDLTGLSEAPELIDSVTRTFAEKTTCEGWTEEKLNKAVENLRSPARTVARFLFLPEVDWKIAPPQAQAPPVSAGGATPAPTATTAAPAATTAASVDVTKIRDQLALAREKLAKAARTLESLVRTSFSAAAQTRANLLVHEILRWTDSNKEGLDELRKRIDVRLFILDDNPDAHPYSFSRYKQVVTELGPRLGWALASDVRDFDRGILDRIRDQAEEVRELHDDGCCSKICDLLNPPCAPCDDLCVPLASVEVRCCQVMAVCILVRTLIISPAALGYWIPLHELLEALCCCRPERDKRDEVIEKLIGPFRKARAECFGHKPTDRQKPDRGGDKS